MIIPRNWTSIEYQRFPEQIRDVAIPAATDGRFKAAPFCLFIAWLVTVYSLWHSIKHYRARERSVLQRTLGFFSYTPWRFLILLPLSLAVPVFMEMVAWEFAWSPLNVTGMNVAIYVGGYVPSLLILLVQSIFGYFNPNEDKELLRQRRMRERAINQEMGLVNKPGWWSRLNREGLPGESMRDIIARNVAEVGGRKPQPTSQNELVIVGQALPPQDTSVEMSPMPQSPRQESDLPVPVAPGDFSGVGQQPGVYTGRSDTRRQERTMQAVSGLLFPGQNEGPAAAARRHAELMMDGPVPLQPPPPYEERGRPPTTAVGNRPAAAARSVSTDTDNTLTNPPQQIRSMLDI